MCKGGTGLFDGMDEDPRWIIQSEGQGEFRGWKSWPKVTKKKKRRVRIRKGSGGRKESGLCMMDQWIGWQDERNGEKDTTSFPQTYFLSFCEIWDKACQTPRPPSPTPPNPQNMAKYIYIWKKNPQKKSRGFFFVLVAIEDLEIEVKQSKAKREILISFLSFLFYILSLPLWKIASPKWRQRKRIT